MSSKSKMLVAILGITIGTLSIDAARPATWHVSDGSGATLKQTISDAHSGDTIFVGPGTYSIFNGFYVSKPLHIIGEKGPSVTVIDNYGGCIGVGGPCYGALGFDVCCFAGSFTIKGFTIRDCEPGGELVFDGYGIRALRCSGIISDNVLTDNALAIDVAENAHVVIENNLIHTNNGIGIGVNSDASADIRFNTFVNNRYAEIELLSPVSINTIVRNNIIALGRGWGLSVEDAGAVSLSCNNIWGNASGDCQGVPAGWLGADGNISLDALFCDGFYLHLESPCLGANTPALCNGDHMGCYPVACEVATEKQSWGKVKSIFR